jgi:hypothetical protein
MEDRMRGSPRHQPTAPRAALPRFEQVAEGSWPKPGEAGWRLLAPAGQQDLRVASA